MRTEASFFVWLILIFLPLNILGEDSHEINLEPATAKELTTNNIGYVEYFNYMVPPIFKASRIKSLQTKWKTLKVDLGDKIVNMGIVDNLKPDAQSHRKKAHCNYDFEETDYPHE